MISEIIIACSENKKDNQIVNLCKRKKISFYVGSEINVLDRYYRASKKHKGDTIIRITSDCPLMDPKLLDNFITDFLKKFDYVSNTLTRTYPDGLDIEIFNYKSLHKAWKRSSSDYEKEHVTPYFKKDKNQKIQYITRKRLF